MAPKKSKRDESVESSKVVDGDISSSSTGVTQNLTRRVTRSSTAAASSSAASSLASLPEQPPAKKKPRKSSKKEEVKPPKDDEVKPKDDEVKSEDDEVPENNVSFEKTFIIEHCKQCKCFKVRADKVKNGLENGVNGIKVLINPEKPRRGCFEVREEGGEAFITLLDLKRPFKKLKDLDMDEPQRLRKQSGSPAEYDDYGLHILFSLWLKFYLIHDHPIAFVS
ncbi:hypothetical protein BVC80_8709g5 [Macleaya cordata]|uniref:Selenoprotein n=1 Tax=Macleaya cordata TaxID=56857 RepID=A0A200R8E4_MACCD|nr:hypothetical protein BVC80_8709g5 [Macleaya cordata]